MTADVSNSGSAAGVAVKTTNTTDYTPNKALHPTGAGANIGAGG